MNDNVNTNVNAKYILICALLNTVKDKCWHEVLLYLNYLSRHDHYTVFNTLTTWLFFLNQFSIQAVPFKVFHVPSFSQALDFRLLQTFKTISKLSSGTDREDYNGWFRIKILLNWNNRHLCSALQITKTTLLGDFIHPYKGNSVKEFFFNGWNWSIRKGKVPSNTSNPYF